MAKYEELLLHLLRGTSDANIPFNDLRQLGNKAKVYQARQVRAVILKYGLGGKK